VTRELAVEGATMSSKSLHKKGYLWLTLAFFLISFGGHWLFAWSTYVREQTDHNQPVKIRDYLSEVSRDTLENWQSEFLQLIWQVVGLTYFLYVGSPSSKEGDDRKEAKLDYLLRRLDPDQAEAFLRQMDQKYPKA
jgi:hypothetical protein